MKAKITRHIVRMFLSAKKYTYIHVDSLECFFFLFVPQLGVQNFNPWRRDHLADGINLPLARKRKRAQSVADPFPRHDEHHPDPAIERAHHLAGHDRARAHDPAEDGRERPRRDVDARAEGRRERARHVVDEAAAGDVRHGLEEPRARRGEHGARVERRRRQQRVAERRRRGRVPGTGGAVGRAGARDDGAHEGEAVGVQAC